jgi:hypothetical protein
VVGAHFVEHGFSLLGFLSGRRSGESVRVDAAGGFRLRGSGYQLLSQVPSPVLSGQ